MPVKLRILLAVCLVLVQAVLAGQPVRAQTTDIRFAKMQIDLWPEYDNAGVLVIYRVELSAETPRPVEISLRLPPGATINAVAVHDVDGTLLSVEYDEEASGAWKLIRFQVTLPEIQIEYYDPNLSRNGTARSFTYQWAGDYAVDEALAVIQRPFDASDLSVSPGPTTSQLNTDGLTYFTKDIGSLSAGQAFQLDVNYTKESEQLSIEFMEVQPLDNSTGETPTSQNTQSWLVWLLVGVGVALIGGGSYWYWRTTQKEQPSRRHRSRASTSKANTEQGDDLDVYCHKCGRRAAAGDRFCRGCGERLRR